MSFSPVGLHVLLLPSSSSDPHPSPDRLLPVPVLGTLLGTRAPARHVTRHLKICLGFSPLKTRPSGAMPVLFTFILNVQRPTRGRWQVSGGPARRACDSAPSALLGQPPLTAPPKPRGHSEEPGGQSSHPPGRPEARPPYLEPKAAASGPGQHRPVVLSGLVLRVREDGPEGDHGKGTPTWCPAEWGDGQVLSAPPQGRGLGGGRAVRVAWLGLRRERATPQTALLNSHVCVGNTSPQPALHGLHSELDLLRSSLRLRARRPPFHRKPC